MALVERCRASSVSHRWKDYMCAAFPSSCSLKFEYKATRDGAELPRSWFHFAKFINWKVVEQTAATWSSTSRITSASRSHWGVFFLGFLKSKQFKPPNYYFTPLQKKVHADETNALWFSKFLQACSENEWCLWTVEAQQQSLVQQCLHWHSHRPTWIISRWKWPHNYCFGKGTKWWSQFSLFS